jgi:hypothetical protein
MSSYTKDPDAVLDYSVDWSSWLDDAETVASHVVIASTGITVDSDNEAAGVVTVWLSGGTVGERYTVTTRITTSAGRTDDRSIEIWVRQR